MEIVKQISVDELSRMSEKMYEPLVKAVVDVKRKELVVDMEMHADGESYLLEHGSNQDDLWGIKLYPGNFGKSTFIEYDSMINIRPRRDNPSRDVLDPAVREEIKRIVIEVAHG